LRAPTSERTSEQTKEIHRCGGVFMGEGKG
jgi:hypothetical protein